MSASAGLGTLGLGPDHEQLHDAVRRWVDANVDPRETKAALDEEEDALPTCWQPLVDQVWIGLALPEELGGEGFGLLELAVVLEELGRACTPGPFVPTVLAALAIARTGSTELCAHLLPDLVAGAALGAVAWPAPGTPGLARATITAAGGDGSLVVQGRVGPVAGAGHASVVVVPAVAADAEGRQDAGGPVTWVVVRTDAAGVRVEPRPSTDGTRRVAMVELDGVAVAAGDQLGARADAELRALVPTLLAAEAAGSAAWCVEVAARYACEREQFGRPIGQFQAVKHRCAAMAVALERARAVAWDAARALDRGPLDDAAALSASIAGAVALDAAAAVAQDAVQVLGGIGYTWDHDVHLHLKRALADRQLLGGPGPWRRLVARGALAGVRLEARADLPPEAEPIRAEVRAFAESLQARPRNEWNAAMADAGYLAPHWPEPWGRGAGALEQLVIDEELAAARIRRPHLQVGAWVLPTLVAHGSTEQQERWIRPTLHGQILWCQLFSEPGAGSDLASLRTKAVRDDERGGWRITGQKVWTTMAHLANWGLLLARSDPDAPKHLGITCFVLDMTTPGIDIRPLRELTGAEMFNEVFLDDVFVPDDAVVGEAHAGWEAARTTLANERVSMGSGSSFGPGLEAVLDLARRQGLSEDAAVLERLGGLVADGHAIAVLGLRQTLRALAGGQPGAEASVRKLLSTEHDQDLQQAGLDLLGPEAAATDGDAASWIGGFLGNRALSIAGGTSDIQRNVIAERLLGLPKDP